MTSSLPSTLAPCPSRFQELPCLFQLLSATLSASSTLQLHTARQPSPSSAGPPSVCAVIICLAYALHFAAITLPSAFNCMLSRLPSPNLYHNRHYLFLLTDTRSSRYFRSAVPVSFSFFRDPAALSLIRPLENDRRRVTDRPLCVRLGLPPPGR